MRDHLRKGHQEMNRAVKGLANTERKRTEEALYAEKQRFQTLSENAPFGMVMIDKDGTFKYINPKFKEIFGYDLTDVPNGKTWFRKAFPDPTSRHHVISAWMKDQESLNPGEKRPRSFTVTCKDGTEKIINFITVQLEMREYLMTCEDFTGRKRGEETLRRSEATAKRMASENSVIAEIGRIISSTLNIEEVYERFTEEVRKLIPFDRIAININNLEEDTLMIAYVSGMAVPGRSFRDVIPVKGTLSE
jgi:PAS domain S-box-containing protein